MAHAVFTAKPGSDYDDLVEFRYQFPSTYLNCARSAVGDWIIYYEPRRNGGRQAYFATARVDRIEPDRNRGDHFYAYVRDFLEFDHPVGFRTADGTSHESGLSKSDGSTNKGAFGRAVRPLSEREFVTIMAAGFQISLHGEDGYYRLRQQPLPPPLPDTIGDAPRPLITQLISRPFRDEAFRHAVRRAYRSTCAFTGLSILNGGGRPEVQAAHIRAVEDDGPDSIRNGIALSGTVHWMFDRGLLGIGDDYEILIHRAKVPQQVIDLFDPSGRIRLPGNEADRPHPEFVRHHRRSRFERAG